MSPRKLAKEAFQSAVRRQLAEVKAARERIEFERDLVVLFIVFVIAAAIALPLLIAP